MLETSARLLRLLSLLQARRDWTSAELADRLGVTTRTVRNDVDRLRRARLSGRRAAGRRRRLPARRAAAPCRRCCSTTTRRSPSRSGCAPPRAARSPASRRRRYGRWPSCSRCCRRGCVTGSARSSRTPCRSPSRRPSGRPGRADHDRGACRDHERLRFDYRAHSGATSRRAVEPYRLVNDRRRWYLLAWDLDRDDWRTFRVDRIEPAHADRAALHAPRAAAGPARSRRRWPAASARRPGGTGRG